MIVYFLLSSLVFLVFCVAPSPVYSLFRYSVSTARFIHVLYYILKMSQLSYYIQNQLTQLKSQVEVTPPRRGISLTKIKQLINTAPIPFDHKIALKKITNELQTAFQVKTTPIAQNSNNKLSSQQLDTPYPLFKSTQNLPTFTQHLNHKHNSFPVGPNESMLCLQKQYQQLKAKRLQKERHLQELIIRVQKLERIHKSRAKSASLYQQNRQIQQKYRQKQEKLRDIRAMTLKAVKLHQFQTTHTLMHQYYRQVDEKRR